MTVLKNGSAYLSTFLREGDAFRWGLGDRSEEMHQTSVLKGGISFPDKRSKPRGEEMQDETKRKGKTEGTVQRRRKGRERNRKGPEPCWGWRCGAGRRVEDDGAQRGGRAEAGGGAEERMPMQFQPKPGMGWDELALRTKGVKRESSAWAWGEKRQAE